MNVILTEGFRALKHNHRVLAQARRMHGLVPAEALLGHEKIDGVYICESCGLCYLYLVGLSQA